MAATALTQLQEQIEAVRREAFAAGYAAAMQAVRELTSRPTPGAPETGAAPAPRRGRPRGSGRQPAKEEAPARSAAATRPRGRPRRGGPGSRPQRGTNARLVEEVLQSFGRAARPTEIRAALQKDKGVGMAFTSIRHALGQLEARGSVEAADDKTWRYKGGSSSGG